MDGCDSLVDVDALTRGDHRGGDRGGALPAGAAVEVDGVALIEPCVDGRHGVVEQLRGEAAVVDRREAALTVRQNIQFPVRENLNVSQRLLDEIMVAKLGMVGLRPGR